MTKGYIDKPQPIWRLYFVFMVIIALLGTISWKIADLQVLDNDHLQRHGDNLAIRNEVLAAHRGNILDRNGQPLAISTPVQSLVINPKVILQHPEQWKTLSDGLLEAGINSEVLKNKITANANKEFLYIKRRMPPLEAQKILDLNITGLYAQEEYKRYYPLGEVAVHIVGLANADDVGQEGMELAYEDWLRGVPGSKQFIKDRKGGIISEVKINSLAEPGNNLELSIDSRIQYLAYKSLKEAVTLHHASAGTAVVLDVESGEVLAMVSQPSYNPNNRSTLNDGQKGLKNRAIADAMAPGSTVKAFTVTAALESGLFDSQSIIDTTPGCVRVDRKDKCDPVDYGEVSLERILTKSSQVGAIKIGLQMGEGPMLDVLSRVGFGQPIGSGFPGEASGVLVNHTRWSKSDIAAMAYGYGFQVSPLQLAQAYMVYANGGIKKPVSLLKVEGEVIGERIIDQTITEQVTRMLETVIVPGGGGTGTLAHIPSYRVAGKTGTTRIYNTKTGDFDSDNHIALFAGYAPASNPKIVTVITIHEPRGKDYGGGKVAAPVFSKIVAGAMRILNVAPDNIEEIPQEISLVSVNSGSSTRSSL